MQARNSCANARQNSGSVIAAAWLTGRAKWHAAPRMTRWRALLRTSSLSQEAREIPWILAVHRREV